MTILIILAALILIFFVIGKRAGTAILAIIAGSLLDQLINSTVTQFIHNILSGIPFDLISAIISLTFIIVAPIILYFRSDKLYDKIPKLVQSIALSAVLLSLSIESINLIFLFDGLSGTIVGFLAGATHLIVIISFVVAYWDIIFLRQQ